MTRATACVSQTVATMPMIAGALAGDIATLSGSQVGHVAME